MYFDLQKASMLKRISAWLLDAIMFAILAVGFGFIISFLVKFDAKYDNLSAVYESYEQQYGISTSITEEDFNALSDAELSKYQAAFDAMNADAELNYAYSVVMNMTLLILSFGFLLAFLVTDFFTPLFFGDGQTLGKKIFGICLMQVDHLKVSKLSLLVRAFLGKFTIETMVPALIIIMIYFNFIGIAGTITIMLLGIVQLVLLIATSTNSVIHDILAKTVVVDAKSQMIFESNEQMLEYKQKM